MDEPVRTHYATCPLCEATCGLEITAQGRAVLGIRGDDADVFSHGYLCPKAYGLKELHADPDRLRRPLVRRGDAFVEVSWDEAFAEIARRLPPILERHGRDAVAAYLGNPNVHNLSLQLYGPVFLRALRSRNIFTASTLDQMPKHVSSALLFGEMLSIPIPDVDRTDYVLILGANPLVSNGSLMTAPDMRGRLRRLRARGGKVVVIDPRRTRTADEADEHHFIQPGTDAYLLLGMVHTLFAEGLVRPGRLAEHTEGIEVVRETAEGFPPERVSPICGIAPETIRRLARDLAGAERAVVYGRIGTCTQEFGTLTSWLVDVLNVLTGNLDRAGGAMFPMAAAGARNTSGEPGHGKGMRPPRHRTRVRGLSEVLGEFPTAALAEEILTPGEGQIRALVTIAGNPALSAPHGAEVTRAFEHLDFMVSIDCYLNETTRHADVILPPASPLTHAHYDLAFYQLSVRNIARYSPAVFAPEADALAEWELLLRIAGIVMGLGPVADLAAMDDFVAAQLVERETRTPHSPIAGREASEILASLAPRRGPERLLDFLLRVGPYGDGFGAHASGASSVDGASGANGLTLAALEDAPHGVDLGPLQPRIPEVLRTPSGRIELAPAPLLNDVARLRRGLSRPRPAFVLIGRRELRTNNSWMHNVSALVKGPDACALQMHPDDAARLGLVTGARARITSAAGSIEAPVHVTDRIMPGVVSLPHGWGHDQSGTRMAIAHAHAGVNVNRLTATSEVEPLSGNALLNAIPVSVVALVGVAPASAG